MRAVENFSTFALQGSRQGTPGKSCSLANNAELFFWRLARTKVSSICIMQRLAANLMDDAKAQWGNNTIKLKFYE